MSEHQLHHKDQDPSIHASTVVKWATFFESALNQDASRLLKALLGQIRRKEPTRLDASTACRFLTFQPVHLGWRVRSLPMATLLLYFSTQEHHIHLSVHSA